MAKRGRPSLYTPEIAEAICDGLRSGLSLRQVCSEKGMPSAVTVLDWVKENREGFSDHYARAREIGYLTIADDILDIADGGLDPSLEDVARDRLRVDTRKWMLSKVLPKIYGDKTTVENTGPDGATLFPTMIELVPARKGED